MILLDEFKSQANKNIKKHIRKKGNNNKNAQRFIAMRLLWLLCAASFFLSFSIFPLPKFFRDPSKILEEVSSEMAPFLSCSFISFYYYFHMIFREWGMLGDSSGFRF